MGFKIVYLFLILSMVLAVSSDCIECKHFKCDPYDPTKIYEYDFYHSYYCQGGKICNINCVPPFTSCVFPQPGDLSQYAMSLDVKNSTCNKESFQCFDSEPRKVKIAGVKFEMECSAGSVCNKDYEQPCSACIAVEITEKPTTPRPKCKNFICFPYSLKKVNMIGVGSILNCPGDKVCNRESKEPCEPCV